MADSVDPDQMPHYVESDLELHCLLIPICPNTKDTKVIYGNLTDCQGTQKHDQIQRPFVTNPS